MTPPTGPLSRRLQPTALPPVDAIDEAIAHVLLRESEHVRRCRRCQNRHTRTVLIAEAQRRVGAAAGAA